MAKIHPIQRKLYNEQMKTGNSIHKILYLVHDLNDPAVHKRIVMLTQGGAEVTIAGFRRTDEPVDNLANCHTINLGQTYNGNFIQRLLSVIREVMSLKKHRDIFNGNDTIIARNLEMLAIGVRGRSLCANKTTLIYESLDIHRLLLSKNITGIILRRLEGWLSKRACALITSSPAFIRKYFNPISKIKLPIKLIENKVYNKTPETNPITTTNHTKTRPWKIGWFGAIRCKKSLEILEELVERSNGEIEIIIRGRPSFDQFDDFYTSTNSNPAIKFLGEYQNPQDLQSIYGEVHFTWAVDMFEEGKNSSWLLPNRLYEGCLYGSVPMAIDAVETGNFIKNLGIGFPIKEPKLESLASFFKSLTEEKYSEMQASVTKIPKSQWSYDVNDCKELVDYIISLKE